MSFSETARRCFYASRYPGLRSFPHSHSDMPIIRKYHGSVRKQLGQLFGAAGRLKPIRAVGVFAEVQDAHERLDQFLLADDGKELFTDTCMVFANDRHVRVAVGERTGSGE
jgi:hypothetical protein